MVPTHTTVRADNIPYEQICWSEIVWGREVGIAGLDGLAFVGRRLLAESTWDSSRCWYRSYRSIVLARSGSERCEEGGRPCADRRRGSSRPSHPKHASRTTTNVQRGRPQSQAAKNSEQHQRSIWLRRCAGAATKVASVLDATPGAGHARPDPKAKELPATNTLTPIWMHDWVHQCRTPD
ncbi:hypothetical protein M409DRAFT_60831 [Zasmidium cellare ATCC 36951]|uniref:Uncharacterized protein n=1 Tax=Zasmidium cellare ATCC 36951 TaxID=1080233 RepID=A0A6A6BXG6_ZASCE|nr:uncharacterized protein M409DRAFT_60831 [Zasmidium cellare ATCC 36951]KAF2159487.1 hypothetical protein M409DRAFT_60831 [Zasmidium cellare ATCC 36951]